MSDRDEDIKSDVPQTSSRQNLWERVGGPVDREIRDEPRYGGDIKKPTPNPRNPRKTKTKTRKKAPLVIGGSFKKKAVVLFYNENTKETELGQIKAKEKLGNAYAITSFISGKVIRNVPNNGSIVLKDGLPVYGDIWPQCSLSAGATCPISLKELSSNSLMNEINRNPLRTVLSEAICSSPREPEDCDECKDVNVCPLLNISYCCDIIKPLTPTAESRIGKNPPFKDNFSRCFVEVTIDSSGCNFVPSTDVKSCIKTSESLQDFRKIVTRQPPGASANEYIMIGDIITASTSTGEIRIKDNAYDYYQCFLVTYAKQQSPVYICVKYVPERILSNIRTYVETSTKPSSKPILEADMSDISSSDDEDDYEESSAFTEDEINKIVVAFCPDTSTPMIIDEPVSPIPDTSTSPPQIVDTSDLDSDPEPYETQSTDSPKTVRTISDGVPYEFMYL